MRHSSTIFGGFAVALAAALAFGAGAGPAQAAANDAENPVISQVECGKPGQPACPLQAWMRTNVATPLASNDMAALARGLEKAASLSPDPGWAAWPTLANQGAEAAKKGDLAGARAACKGCHDAFREAYRAKYRTRPIPR
jgi:hypothetical protein